MNAALHPAGAGRLRAAVVFVLLLVGAWLRPWTEAATATGVRLEAGPGRTGAVAAGLLLVLAGLAITALAARFRSDLRRGEALTSALLATFMLVLLGVGHRWVPGGVQRGVVAPVFIPLGLLALLDAFDPRPSVALIRGAGGLLVALLLGLAGAAFPAGVALWLGLAPLALRRAPTRRTLSMLQLVAAAAAFFAPLLYAHLMDFEDSGLVFDGRYLWQVASIVLMALALVGTMRPREGT